MFDTIYPINLIVISLILLPNFLFIQYPPINMPNEKVHVKPSWWMIIIVVEWVGRLGSFLLPLFWEMKVENVTDCILIGFMILCLLIYYCLWANYILRGRDYKNLLSSLFFIPVPMAVFPALYFLINGILLESGVVIAAAILFALGHIPESIRSREENR